MCSVYIDNLWLCATHGGKQETPMRVANDRLILCPYGIAPHDRAACATILAQIGGDLSRLIDAPAGAAAFLAHIKRLSGMLAAVRPPIVLLTSVTPLLAQVVLLRKHYESELSPLRHADWMLYVDGSARAFLSEALRLGTLDRTHGAPLWQSPSGGRYLIASPDSNPGDLVRALRALREDAPGGPVQNPSRANLQAPANRPEAKPTLQSLKQRPSRIPSRR